jgi:hypothetical protein
MAVAAVAAALVVPTAPAAMAGDDDGEVRRTGACSGSADWKLKAKHDDGRIEVEWEVDSNRSGQTWRVRVFDNGARVVATRATTHDPSGSFSVERKITDRAGSDRIVARSRHLATGQVCRGSLTF